jgi:hypothetical protein
MSPLHSIAYNASRLGIIPSPPDYFTAPSSTASNPPPTHTCQSLARLSKKLNFTSTRELAKICAARPQTQIEDDNRSNPPLTSIVARSLIPDYTWYVHSISDNGLLLAFAKLCNGPSVSPQLSNHARISTHSSQSPLQNSIYARPSAISVPICTR